MTDTPNRDDIALELSALTSKSSPLTASEERRRRWLLSEMADAEVSAGVAEVRAMYDQHLRRDPAAENAWRDS